MQNRELALNSLKAHLLTTFSGFAGMELDLQFLQKFELEDDVDYHSGLYEEAIDNLSRAISEITSLLVEDGAYNV